MAPTNYRSSGKALSNDRRAKQKNSDFCSKLRQIKNVFVGYFGNTVVLTEDATTISLAEGEYLYPEI